MSLNFEAVREIFWKTNDMGRSRARSDGWELQVTWPRWLGIFWCTNRIKRFAHLAICHLCVFSYRKLTRLLDGRVACQHAGGYGFAVRCFYSLNDSSC